MIPLDFYLSNPKLQIKKILLVSFKNNIKWVNELTEYKELNLVFLYLKLKSSKFVTKSSSSHIEEGDLSINSYIEIYTLNKTNPLPDFKNKDLGDKKKFKKKIYRK